MGRPKEKNTLGRPWRRWEENIKVDLKEVGWGGIEWIDLAQDRDSWRATGNKVMNLRVPLNEGNVLTSWGTVSFSWRALLHRVNVERKFCCDCLWFNTITLRNEDRFSLYSVWSFSLVLAAYLRSAIMTRKSPHYGARFESEATRVYSRHTHAISFTFKALRQKRIHPGLGYSTRITHAWAVTSRPTDGNSGYPPNSDREVKH